jgi:UrcA family protein
MTRTPEASLMKTLLCLVFAIAASAAFSADSRDPQVARVVRYGDLDLTRPAGVATLHSRIRSAASVVCRPSFDDRAPEHVAATRFCVQQAVARALDDVQSAGARTAVAMLSPLQR